MIEHTNSVKKFKIKGMFVAVELMTPFSDIDLERNRTVNCIYDIK